MGSCPERQVALVLKGQSKGESELMKPLQEPDGSLYIVIRADGDERRSKVLRCIAVSDLAMSLLWASILAKKFENTLASAPRPQRQGTLEKQRAKGS